MGKKKKAKKVRDGGHMLHHSLTEVADRLAVLASTIPEDTENLKDEAWDELVDTVQNIWSIEAEWILDDELRKELSIIQLED